MDLSFAMRYVMVQAQREAFGETTCAEHIYLAILSLFGKNEEDIARKPEQTEQVREDIAAVSAYVFEQKIDVLPTRAKIHEVLAGSITSKQLPAPDNDVAGLVARADRIAQRAGHTVTMVSDVLEAVSASSFIEPCVVHYDKGQTPVPATDATTFNSSINATHAETIQSSKPKPIVASEPEPEPEPAPRFNPEPPPAPANIPVPEPQPPAQPVVFFEIPKPEEPERDAKGRIKKIKTLRKTEIGLLTFNGGPFLAAVKYYMLLSVLLAGAYLAYSWFLGAWTEQAPYRVVLLVFAYIWLQMALKGFTCLVAMRYKPFKIFADTLINVALFGLLALLIADARGWTIPIWGRVLATLYVLFYILYGAVRLNMMQPSAEQGNFALSTTMLKIRGTSGAIFFGYLLRSCLIPCIAFSVLWIGNLQLNELFRAVFFFYGFLWAYDILRVLIQTLKLTHDNKLLAFLQMQHLLLGLPALELFSSWYFASYSMPVWLIVVCAIYGVLWLVITIGSLVALHNR